MGAGRRRRTSSRCCSRSCTTSRAAPTSSSSPARCRAAVDADFYAELIRELNRRQVQTVLDSEGEPLRLGLEAEPFLVSPNQREAEALVGQEFYEQQDFAYALEHIAELGARNVLITNESGCFARLREGRKTRRFRVLAPQVEPVSAVGCGDVLLAGFIAARARQALDRGRAARRRRRGRGLDARARRGPLRARGVASQLTRTFSVTDLEAVTSDR